MKWLFLIAGMFLTGYAVCSPGIDPVPAVLGGLCFALFVDQLGRR